MATIGRPEVLAKRSGPCAWSSCEERIVKGEDFIAKVGKGWMHSHCAIEHDRLQEVRQSHEEEAA
jgi:hypothetical protein